MMPKNKNFYPLAILAITLIGLMLRLKLMSTLGSYWFDEMASVTIAKFDFPKILEYLAVENNPPLSYIYLHFWIKLFGDGETATRISSLLFGVAAIPLTYLAGKEIFSKKTGLIASFFMAFSFSQINYSVEARMYSLLVFLTLASMYFYWKSLKENKKVYWIFYAISSLFLVYTHMYGWFVILFQSIFLFLCQKNYPGTKNNLFRIDCVLIFSFLIWLIPKLYSMTSLPIMDGWFFQLSVTPLAIVYLLNEVISYGNESANKIIELISESLVLVLILSSLITFLKFDKKNTISINFTFKKEIFFMILWITISAFMAYILNIVQPKYLILVAPAFYFLMAEGIANFGLNRTAKSLVVILFSSILLINAWPALANKSNMYFWDTLSQYIKDSEKPADKIIVHSFMDTLEIKRYYSGNAPYEGFYIFNDNGEKDLDKLIIMRNWNNYLHRKDAAAVNDRLNAMTTGYKRIFLVDSASPLLDPENLVVNWFAQNNWRLTEKKVFRPSIKPYIWVWEKIDPTSATSPDQTPNLGD